MEAAGARCSGTANIIPMTGARVGNWYLESEIGSGALGIVYRARGYDDPQRQSAVKVFTATTAQDAAFVQKFASEMLPLQRLDHANIVRYFDSGTHAGLAYVACELVEGEDYARRLESGCCPWREVLSVAVQTARALKHAHNRNVLHRDLKPAHLMMTADGTLKVLGFGLAKVVPAPPPSTSPSIGTAAYIPPETASGKPLTRRSDFYSLGGVLYTLVTGRPPFAAASLVELMHKQCYTLPERPALLVPELPAELDEFICVLLDKNPGRRPATAAALLDELERLRGKLERKGERLEWPAKITPDTAELEALPAALGGTTEREEAPAARPLMRRPLVVIPLFLLVLSALVAPFVWPSPSADQLYATAKPLLESENLEDWQKAVDEYLEPLEQKYPGQYTQEIEAARVKLNDRREMRRALAEGTKVDPRSDAERVYLRGLRLAQAGDPDAARRIWQAMVVAFGPLNTESRWVNLAKVGLETLNRPESRGRRALPDRQAFDAALRHAKSLAGTSGAGEAAAILRALEELFQDDPDLQDALRAAREGK